MDNKKPIKKSIFKRISQFFKIKWLKFLGKFDLEKRAYEKLPEDQKKAIDIASVCIFNKNSKLYKDKSGLIQIDLPEIVITTQQTGGFYEVDFVYKKQPVPTCDKVMFDSSTINHIYSKFEREVESRMNDNIKIKDGVVNSHLDNLHKAVISLR